jgi:hypothetical protein
MVKLSVNPNKALPNCDEWLTLSCSGKWTDQVRAYRMLDQFQLAYATNRKVEVWFQDDKTHDGYCFANRVEVVR